MLGYWYGKKFYSKIAWTNRKEGDKPLPVSIPQRFSNSVILHTYPPLKMKQTECSEMSTYKIQTPGNYPEESVQHSEHSESLKSRTKDLYERQGAKCVVTVLWIIRCSVCRLKTKPEILLLHDKSLRHVPILASFYYAIYSERSLSLWTPRLTFMN